MKMHHQFYAAAVLLSVTVAACGPSMEPQASGPEAISADSAAAMEARFFARRDSAQMRYSQADVEFMTRMVHHHAQALEMARLAPDRTNNTRVRTLAARIINAQNDEIATMQRWLFDRGQPVPQPAEHTHGESMMSMPGMATPEQLQRLRDATGTQFDRLFLSLMIPHHAGAVTMVHELFATDGAGQDEQAFKIASDAQVDQTTEIERMELMLENLPRDEAQ